MRSVQLLFVAMALAAVDALVWRPAVRFLEAVLAHSDNSCKASKADVVIVPGYRLSQDASPSPLLAQRIAHAVVQASEHRCSLLFTGGVPPEHPGTSEGQEMLKHAQLCHPSALHKIRRVLIENRSTTTRENALFSIALLLSQTPRAKRLLIVTNQFHQRRACGAFARAAEGMGLAGHICCVAVPPSLDGPQPAGPEELQSHGVPKMHPNACQIGASTVSVDPHEVGWLALREMLALLKYRVYGWM